MKRLWSLLARVGVCGLLFFSACTPRIFTPPPAPIILSGVVQLAPVKNERIKAYPVLPNGEVSSVAAAEGLTDSNGNFTLSVPPGVYAIKTEGIGEHLDEATGQWEPACELTALIDTNTSQEVPVTPMTTLLKERALDLVKAGQKNLSEAQVLASQEIAPKFYLNVEDMSQVPVSPYAISDMSALERSSKKRRIKMAEKLAVFSHFVNDFSFPGLSANEKLSKLLEALQADFKDDGKMNGSVSGTLGLVAKKAALQWRTGMNTARAATRSPSSALAFKHANIQEAVESVTDAVVSEEDRFDTGSALEGWNTADGIYYIDGVQTNLDSDGEGLFLDEYYFSGRLAQVADGIRKDGKYYHQGLAAHGVFNKVCYSQGGITTELNTNGNGTCSATSRYYEDGELKTGWVSDPTVLLMHMDGSEGAQTFTDSASAPKSATVNGAAVISAAQSKFGSGSGAFNSDSDNLLIPAHSDFNLLASDWTVEFWYYPTGRHGIASSAVGVWRDWPVTRAYWFGVLPDGSIFFKLNGDESSDFLSGPMDIVPLNTWSHIAFTRSGSTLRAFLNGNKIGEFQFETPIIDILDTPLAVGAKGSFDNSVRGYLDEVRITKGLARYTSNFAPAGEPFTSEAVAASGYYIAGELFLGLDETGTGTHITSGRFFLNGSIANGLVGDPGSDKTVLLTHMDGENGSTSFIDSSLSSRMPTEHSYTQLSTTQSKFGSASANFINPYSRFGSTSGWSHLRYVDDSLIFGEQDFTIEFWAFPKSEVNWNGVAFDSNSSDCAGDGLMVSFGDPWGTIGFRYVGCNGAVFGTRAITYDEWHHIAMARSNGEVRCYVDGALAFTLPSRYMGSNTISLGGGAPNIPPYYSFDGFIDEVRITKGLARYTSNFTPSTEAFTTSACYSNGLDTGTVIDGTGSCSGIYYLAGTATLLPLNGTGEHDGKYYVNGSLANGLLNGACYSAGLNTGTYSNGNGACAGSYYLSGIAQAGLDSTGTGLNANDGLYYVNGSIANGYVDDKTVLLMHMDGTDGSQSFVDSSNLNMSLSTNGNTSTSIAQSKFGGASGYFDGQSYVRASYLSELNLRESDFTVEAWVYSTVTVPDYQAVVAAWDNDLANFVLGIKNGAAAVLWPQSDSTLTEVTGGVIQLNQWHHLAFSRLGSVGKLFLDGIPVATFTTSVPSQGPGSGILIGKVGLYYDAYFFNGYIDELRITKGLARYTANFTPSQGAFSPIPSGYYIAGVLQPGSMGTWSSQGTQIGCSEPGGDPSSNLLGEAWGSTAFGPNVHGGNCINWCHAQFPGQVMCAQMYATWYYDGGHCACYSSSTTYAWPGFFDKQVWLFTPAPP